MTIEQSPASDDVDLVIVGAGFAGLYMLHKAHVMGLRARCIERATDVGGTWYWNRYPGARCDIESFDYSFSFDDELQQEWVWSEKFATQPEILAYAQHVAERFSLRRDITFGTSVTSAEFEVDSARWSIGTDSGTRLTAAFLVLAVGNLSSANLPEFEGLDRFTGRTFHTASWPHEGVDFTGRRVGVVGTGSSAIQAIPLIAQECERLDVFQRTANYSLPALNSPLDPAEAAERKRTYPEYRRQARRSFTGVPVEAPTERALAVTPQEREIAYERAWRSGKYGALLRAYTDLATDRAANETAAQFIRRKVRDAVDDPDVAAKLSPVRVPFGTKRTCLDTNYYETFNRPNVHLVDVREDPISRITESGIETGTAHYALDDIVFATGFDAMTGSILRIDPRGRSGASLRDAWEAGPRTLLGLASHGFPNLFFITGPGSPSVLSNMIVSIEQHVDWVSGLLAYMREHGLRSVEATEDAQEAWVRHVNEAAAATLYPEGNSWYLGANIPGKTRVFMPYVNGVGAYREHCDEISAAAYRGFTFTTVPRDEPAANPPLTSSAQEGVAAPVHPRKTSRNF